MMKYYFLLACCLVSTVRGEDVTVLDFDAVPDGKTLTTAALQNAIDHCSNSGGGTVTVPPGTYLTHTVYLKNGVNLHLRKGAVILGDTDPTAFDQAVILGDHIEDAALTGLGTVNGQGFARFFPRKGPRHNDVRLVGCKNIVVKDVTMIDAPTWVFRIRECDGVMVRGVRIYSYVNQNNDGIDIDAKNVVVSDCIIDSEDDAICLKSDNPDFLVENITITNCIAASNCNAIKFGTASHGGFRNIVVSNCVLRRPSEAAKIPPRSTLEGCDSDEIMEIGLALEIVDGGVMDQVAIDNITMTGIQTPLFIRLGNRRGTGTLKNVVISNITATDETLLHSSITGIPGSCVENVIVKDLIFNSKGTGGMAEATATPPEKIDSYPQANIVFGYSVPAYGMYMRHVKNLMLQNFVFNLLAPDARPALVMDDCHHIRLNNFDVDPPTNDQPLLRVIQSSDVTISGYQSTQPVSNFLRAEGDRTTDIKLLGNDFSAVENVTSQTDGCQESALKMLDNFQ